MSKLGDKPISIKEGSAVSLTGRQITVSGPLGSLVLNLPGGVDFAVQGNEVRLKKSDTRDKKIKAVRGTYYRLLINALEGVQNGFGKTLEVIGTGFRAQVEGKDLVLNLGFSHPIKFVIPEGITITAEENKIKVFGINKEKVGTVADVIKKFRKPDPYKGKGIRYLGETFKLKPGKAAAKAGPVGVK